MVVKMITEAFQESAIKREGDVCQRDIRIRPPKEESLTISKALRFQRTA